MRRLVLLLLVAVPTAAAPVPKELKKKAQSPDGRWALVKFSSNGAEPTPPKNMVIEWFVEGEVINPGTKAEWAKSVAAKFGPNFTIPDPDRPNRRIWGRNPAVYEVDGDTLRVCHSYEGQKESTECKPGPGIAYFVFERIKEEK